MATEIERKFLVSDLEQLTQALQGEKVTHYEIVQGYLNLTPERQVRVRTRRQIRARTLASPKDTEGFLTIKNKGKGISRDEFEYSIPYEDALQLLQLCVGSLVRKHRRTFFEGWEVDIFEGDNEGLVVAEYELKSEDQELVIPPGIGQEVSEDSRYSNIQLAVHPFKDWSKESTTPSVWQPIETAPKDGTPILIKTPIGVVEAWFAKGQWTAATPYSEAEYEGAVWVCYDDKFEIEVEETETGYTSEATHWMPIPI